MSEQYKTKWNKEQNEYYQDPRWQKKRLEIFDRDKFTCIFCNRKDKTLHAHHLCYLDNLKPWEYENHLIITLCKDCHEAESTKRKHIEKNLLLLFKLLRYSRGNLLKFFDCIFETKSFSFLKKCRFIEMMEILLKSKTLYSKTTIYIRQQQKRDKIVWLLSNDKEIK